MPSLVFKLHLQHSPNSESLKEETSGDPRPVRQLCPGSSRWQTPESCTFAGELGTRELKIRTGLLSPPPSDNCVPPGLCSSSVTSSARPPGSDDAHPSAMITDDGIVKESKLFSRKPSSTVLARWRRLEEFDGKGEEVGACWGDNSGELVGEESFG